MGITARSGPDVTYGVTTTTSGAVTEYNEERGPNVYDMGYSIMDPRPPFSYDPGSAVGTRVAGLYKGRGLVDYVPFAQSSNGVVVSSNTPNPIVTGSLTLRTTNSGGGFIPTTIVPSTGGAAVSVFAIDSTAAQLVFPSSAGAGQVGGSVAMWNPAAGTGRCIRVTTPTCGVTSVTVVGYDMYGYKMSQSISSVDISSQYGITSSDNSVYNWVTTKAFKYVTAVSVSTNTATVNSTGVNVGFIDTYGFPLQLLYTSYDTFVSMINSTNVTVAQSTGGTITLASTLTPASTTGDVRGTWMSSLISDGTRRLLIHQDITSPRAWNIVSSDTAASALFGLAQFSSV